MWQDNNPYGSGSQQAQYYGQPAPQPGVPLQFYAPSPVGSTVGRLQLEQILSLRHISMVAEAE